MVLAAVLLMSGCFTGQLAEVARDRVYEPNRVDAVESALFDARGNLHLCVLGRRAVTGARRFDLLIQPALPLYGRSREHGGVTFLRHESTSYASNECLSSGAPFTGAIEVRPIISPDPYFPPTELWITLVGKEPAQVALSGASQPPRLSLLALSPLTLAVDLVTTAPLCALQFGWAYVDGIARGLGSPRLSEFCLRLPELRKGPDPTETRL
jgi:hypothetical protein